MHPLVEFEVDCQGLGKRKPESLISIGFSNAFSVFFLLLKQKGIAIITLTSFTPDMKENPYQAHSLSSL